MLYSKRRIYDRADYNKIYNVISASFSNQEQIIYPTMGDLDFKAFFESSFDNFINKEAYVWVTQNSEIAGLIWTDWRGTYYYIFHPLHFDVVEIMIEDIEKGIENGSVSNSFGKEVWVWSFNEKQAIKEMLDRRGYGTNGWYWFYGKQSLDCELPPYSFPEGYTVRPITDEDIPQKVALMGVSLLEVSLDIEKYKYLQTSIVYEPSTDLVVLNKGGKVVSFCNVWVDRKNNICNFEPCGTDENYRGKGLMTNLIIYSLHRFKEMGISTAYIPHGGLATFDEYEDDALRLYKKLGFKEIGKIFVRIKNYDESKHENADNNANKEYLNQNPINMQKRWNHTVI